MLALYLPFNIFSIFELVDVKNIFKDKERKALKEYLDYLKSQVNFMQKLIKEEKCEFIEEIDVEDTLLKIDKTKEKIKNYLEKVNDKEIYQLVDEIYSYLLKYELSISQLWVCYENS